MNRRTVIEAKHEAERFIQRCDDLLNATVSVYWVAKDEANPSPYIAHWEQVHGGWQSNEAPKQQGALRRASMDLTRSLAEMRKPS